MCHFSKITSDNNVWNGLARQNSLPTVQVIVISPRCHWLPVPRGPFPLLPPPPPPPLVLPVRSTRRSIWSFMSYSTLPNMSHRHTYAKSVCVCVRATESEEKEEQTIPWWEIIITGVLVEDPQGSLLSRAGFFLHRNTIATAPPVCIRAAGGNGGKSVLLPGNWWW